jgi:hypothetical protein
MKPLLVLLAGTAIAAGPTAAFAGTLPPPPQPSGVPATAPATAGTPGAAATQVTPVTKIRPIASRTRALVLTYAAGEKAKPERYAVLNCPASFAALREREEACVVVNRVQGDLTQLKPSQNTFCPMMFSPVTVTANGIWDGRYVYFKHTFGNACEMHSATGTVFDI